MTEVQVPGSADISPDATHPESADVSEVRPQDMIASFTTSKGSVYTYDEDGHTTRFKTKSGVEQPRQDITVFIDIGIGDTGTIAAAHLLRSSIERTRVEVAERKPDGTVRVIHDVQEVTYPDALQVVTFRGDNIVKSKPASLFPQEGLFVFDSRRFEEHGVMRTERHLGHKVTSIHYKS